MKQVTLMQILLMIITLKFFEYEGKLLGNKEAQPNPNHANGNSKNTTFVVLLKYLSNFWRPIEIPLINWRVELKLKWTKYFVLFVGGNDNFINDNNNTNNIFTIKDTQLYVPVVTLSAGDNQKFSKLLSKGFERSVYWNKHEKKDENKNMN